MPALTSRLAIIGTILKKDLTESLRDRLWILLSALGLVFYVAIFWLLPAAVDETLTVGIRHSGMDIALQELREAEDEGLNIVVFETSEQLKSAVAGEPGTEKDVQIGIDLPDDFLARILWRQKALVRVYVAAGIPEEYKRAAKSMVREIAFHIAGDRLPITEPDEQAVILGRDRLGNQIPFRDKMKPMLAFFVLMFEAFALASLISSEVQTKTVSAVLVTTARIGDVLAAKIILGTLLAFVQAVLLLLAVNALGGGVILLLLIVLLGALMVTGIGMITGSAGRDFMATLFYGMIFMALLAIPAFGPLFPGMSSPWVKVLPSYGIVEGMLGTVIYGRGWTESAPYLVLIVAWDIIIVGSGWMVLKKKVETL